jgi:hypothetical protein
MNLSDINRVCHLAAAQYTFFSAGHGNFYKIGNILGYKASLNE